MTAISREGQKVAECSASVSKSTHGSSNPPRETWLHKADFILSCLGFCVGLGNIWRFPYLCYKNGGGVFFIPYLIFVFFGGIPIVVLEIAAGQFMSQGGMEVWRICPILKGIGYATTVIVFMMNIYYIIVLTWDLLFLFYSFSFVLPWSTCDNWWNTERCSLSACNNTAAEVNGNGSNTGCWSVDGDSENISSVDPAVEFWERRVLQMSNGIDDPNGIVWELALCLLIAWLLVYVCVWKGVQTTGKVVYFTATFPYVILTVLLIRGLTLEGAKDGIMFYLSPDLGKLASAQVWIDAGTQIFFSYAIGLGAMAALGSYNKFNYNCYRDCMIISLVNSFTSVFAGFVIFSVLGFMAHQQGTSIETVATAGPGLAFVVYPKAVSQMPLASFWAILFFFMIVTVALDSQFVGVESFVTVLMDLVPSLRKYHRRQMVVALYCFMCYLVGLTMVTRGGVYVFQLFDYYCASGMALLWVCLAECIAVAWLYGVQRFYDNIEMMIGYQISIWMKICWVVVTPTLTFGVLLWTLSTFELVTYNKSYIYPPWAQALGLCFALSSMVCIPLYAVGFLLHAPGKNITEKWKYSITPVIEPSRLPPKWPDRLELAQFHKAVTFNDQHRPWCKPSRSLTQILKCEQYDQSDNEEYIDQTVESKLDAENKVYPPTPMMPMFEVP